MRYGYLGYTFQHHVAELFLALMDVEREIDSIEIEADVNHNFDDITLSSKGKNYTCQIKDLQFISLEDLIIDEDKVSIRDKVHGLSEAKNILFFSEIDLVANNQVFGIPSYYEKNLHIISLNRSSIDEHLRNLYPDNFSRQARISAFFHEKLDRRILKISKEELPTINVYLTELIEPTIELGLKLLDFNNILLIEGKPGVGKSHLVNEIKKRNSDSTLYRFWVSNQDREYEKRLVYQNFVFDLSKKLFNDQRMREEEMIIAELEERNHLLIIDGLDHVENYNPSELRLFVQFIDRAKDCCKVIVLSRPLKHKVDWKKQLLKNWDREQTEKALKELYHIERYRIISDIYEITGGYPILVKYLAESFKRNGVVPPLSKLDEVNDYYRALVINQKGKQALSLFVCSNAYFMHSEIGLFLEDYASNYVNEFIEEHPYLFEINLNRISLYHDSFNTFLLNEGIEFSDLKSGVKDVVTKSILNLETRFLSRLSSFDLDNPSIKSIVLKYSQLATYDDLIKNVVDFEAITDFYHQLRESLIMINPDDLDLINYFDLGIIISLTSRYSWIASIDSFLYTYTKVLLFNDFSEENITSTGYLFGMLYFIRTGDSNQLRKATSDDYHDVEHFDKRLKYEIEEEEYFFDNHKERLTRDQVESILTERSQFNPDDISYVLENIYFNKDTASYYPDFYDSITKFLVGEEEQGVSLLTECLKKYGISHWSAYSYLKTAQRNILATGEFEETNAYLNLTFNQFVEHIRELNSFDSWKEILSYIRLSLHNEKKIEIHCFLLFLNKYYSRKDYCLVSIHASLNVFESHDLIQKEESVRLISRIQEKSEKGYRGLLSDYIEQYSPDSIIPFLEEKFEVGELHVDWFRLPERYINEVSENTFYAGVEFTFRPGSRHVDFDEIDNVLNSNWVDRLIRIIELRKFTIRIPEKDKGIEALESLGLFYEVYKPDSYSSKETKLDYFNQGILNEKYSELIQRNQLKPKDVASYSDGYHTALAEVSLFESFSPNEIEEEIEAIFYNSITGKVKSINSFYNLYYFMGNSLKLMNDNSIVYDAKTFYSSFNYFLKALMINE